MYISYSEYTDLGGGIDEVAFNRLLVKAESILNQFTFNRLKDKKERKAKYCMFDLIEYLNATNRNGSNVAVTSVGNDGYSETYANVESAKAEQYKIIKDYFGDTDYLYCGVSKCGINT